MTSKSSSDNMTLVIYEDQKIAKCFELSKRQIRRLLIIVPFLLLILFFSTLFFLVYFKDLKTSVKMKEPQMIKRLEMEKVQLLKSQEELKELNHALQEKLEKGVKLEKLSFIPFFRPTPGFQDLSADTLIELDNIKAEREGDFISLDFNMLNKKPDEVRITGHIFIVMKRLNHLHVYPHINENTENAFLTFSNGEPFYFSRLRPVSAKFDLIHSDKVVPTIFRLYIFSRSGDLIFKHQVDPIEL